MRDPRREGGSEAVGIDFSCRLSLSTSFCHIYQFMMLASLQTRCLVQEPRFPDHLNPSVITKSIHTARTTRSFHKVVGFLKRSSILVRSTSYTGFHVPDTSFDVPSSLFHGTSHRNVPLPRWIAPRPAVTASTSMPLVTPSTYPRPGLQLIPWPPATESLPSAKTCSFLDTFFHKNETSLQL